MNTSNLHSKALALPLLAAFLAPDDRTQAQTIGEIEMQPKTTLVRVDVADQRGIWEGWGCSMGWWPNLIGGKKYEELYCDLFFTDRTVRFLDKELPGLDMNIVRYNVGGGGNGTAVKGDTEKVPEIQPWPRRIDGFWVDGESRDPNSKSWDWNRDMAQRSVLEKAIQRGVNQVEFYSNAPMWWMMDSKSSAGGHLLAQHKSDFAYYLATVVEKAQKDWGVRVNYLEPFNEPSAGWWHYPKNQEGANISRADQAEIVGLLREELDRRGLQSVYLTTSDENNMQQARDSWEFFKTREVPFAGRTTSAAALVEKVNVHSYNGLEPMRDNGAREKLRRSVGTTRLWANEFGDNEGGGMKLMQTIIEDINYLRPTAWLYWQPLEPASAWGLVNGHQAPTAQDPNSGQPKWAYTKYFAFAQFTRFLRPGAQVIGSSDPNTIAAYEPKTRRLTFITVNYGMPQKLLIDLSNLKRVGPKAELTQTVTDSSKCFEASSLNLSEAKLELKMVPNAIYSLVIDGVDLN